MSASSITPSISGISHTTNTTVDFGENDSSLFLLRGRKYKNLQYTPASDGTDASLCIMQHLAPDGSLATSFLPPPPSRDESPTMVKRLQTLERLVSVFDDKASVDTTAVTDQNEYKEIAAILRAAQPSTQAAVAREACRTELQAKYQALLDKIEESYKTDAPVEIPRDLGAEWFTPVWGALDVIEATGLNVNMYRLASAVGKHCNDAEAVHLIVPLLPALAKRIAFIQSPVEAQSINAE